MVSGTMGEELERLRSGRTSFEGFATATGADWRRLADYLRRRWWVPEGVESADVAQEMLLSAWVHVGIWDPARGVPLASYVVWSALTDAKKWLHRQRNALRRDGSAPGRSPGAISAPPEGEEPEAGSEEATAEDVVEAREQMTLVLGRRSNVDRRVHASVVASGGDLRRAARVVFSDPEVCLRARVGSEREARRLTARVVREVLRAAVGRENDEDDDER